MQFSETPADHEESAQSTHARAAATSRSTWVSVVVNHLSEFEEQDYVYFAA